MFSMHFWSTYMYTTCIASGLRLLYSRYARMLLWVLAQGAGPGRPTEDDVGNSSHTLLGDVADGNKSK